MKFLLQSHPQGLREYWLAIKIQLRARAASIAFEVACFVVVKARQPQPISELSATRPPEPPNWWLTVTRDKSNEQERVAILFLDDVPF